MPPKPSTLKRKPTVPGSDAKGETMTAPAAGSSGSAKATSAGAGNSEKLSKHEKELYHYCLKADNRTIGNDDLATCLPQLDVVKRMDVVNILIARGMILLKRANNDLFFTAIDRTQQRLSSAMGTDEKVVYDHIASAGNMGIWSKTLRKRINIHDANLTKAIKALEGKSLIKSVKSIEHTTRKIYMLAELQPATELSGGPFYTDNELDTEFIGVLLKGVRKCLQERSFPTVKSGRPIFPTSHTAYLPTTVHDVLDYLKQSQIIQEGTDLTIEHITMLLNVLIYDSEIERITVGTAKDEESKYGAAFDDDSVSSGEEVSELRKRKSTIGMARAGHKRHKAVERATSPTRRRSVDSDEIDADEPRITHRLDFLDADPDEENNRDPVTLDPRQESEEPDVKPTFRPASKSSGRRFPGNEAFVYRYMRSALQSQRATSGIFDMPCGHCPQFDFCAEKGHAWQVRLKGETPLAKVGLAGIGGGFGAAEGLGGAGRVAPVNPVDCVYFHDWLAF